jgi:hypothetical protein
VPTVARIGPYRFFFFSNEGSEPPHIHVQRDRALAKFWLRPVALASASAFAGARDSPHSADRGPAPRRIRGGMA